MVFDGRTRWCEFFFCQNICNSVQQQHKHDIILKQEGNDSSK